MVLMGTLYILLRKRDVSKFHIQLWIVLFCMLIVFVSGMTEHTCTEAV